MRYTIHQRQLTKTGLSPEITIQRRLWKSNTNTIGRFGKHKAEGKVGADAGGASRVLWPILDV